MFYLLFSLSAIFTPQVDLMQNKLNISMKPWENVRSAEGRHGAAHKFIRVRKAVFFLLLNTRCFFSCYFTLPSFVIFS